MVEWNFILRSTAFFIFELTSFRFFFVQLISFIEFDIKLSVELYPSIVNGEISNL